MLFGEDAQKADRPRTEERERMPRSGGYEPRAPRQGGYQPRSPRPGGFRPRNEESPRSEHPLAQQFRRERSGSSSNWRKPGSRPGFKDRKPHY
jgi:hypothetical protein